MKSNENESGGFIDVLSGKKALKTEVSLGVNPEIFLIVGFILVTIIFINIINKK